MTMLKLAKVAILAITTLNVSSAGAGGFVLVLDSIGMLEKQRTATKFAKHYGAGGIALLPEPASAKTDEDPSPSTDIKLKPANPPSDVLEAIEQTALRYAAHSFIFRRRSNQPSAESEWVGPVSTFDAEKVSIKRARLGWIQRRPIGDS